MLVNFIETMVNNMGFADDVFACIWLGTILNGVKTISTE